MLQKYTFINDRNVGQLQKDIEVFFRHIKHVKPTDSFDPAILFPTNLARKVKGRKIKGVVVYNNLYKKAEAFFNKYKRLGNQQSVVLNAFREMNKIAGLLKGDVQRICLADLPASIQKESKELFKVLYEEALTSYGIKAHYASFCNKQKNNWCPFCGMEKLEHYSHQKEDYDHLLAKSIYPFAAINMRNLAPTCKKCNRTHKKTKDIIYDDINQIKAVNPYSAKLDIKVKFDGTILPKGRKKGAWAIGVTPSREEVIRWEYVYEITDRIIKNYFANGKEADFNLWLGEYISVNDLNPDLNSLKKVRESLEKYGLRFDIGRYTEGRYIKSDFFKWIAKNADDTYISSLMDTIQRKSIQKGK